MTLSRLQRPHAAKLKEPESKERKLEDVVKSAEQAGVLVVVC